MKICSSCRNFVDDDAKVCNKCGMRFPVKKDLYGQKKQSSLKMYIGIASGIVVGIVAVILIIFSIIGRGENNTHNTVKTFAKMLPTKIENLNDKVSIPDGSMPEINNDHKYLQEYLCGVWILEGASGNIKEASPTDKTMEVQTSNEKKQMACLPIQLDLGPISIEEDPFIACGVRFGELLFETQDEENYLGLESASIVYDVDGSVLAVGFLDKKINVSKGNVVDYKENAVSEVSVDEFQYKFELSGWKLKLTYGDETAVYVPADIDAGNGVTFSACAVSVFGVVGLNEDREGGGVLAGYETMDDILFMNPAGDPSEVRFTLQTEKTAQYEFSEDGSMSVKTEDGFEKEYKFLYSGRNLVLMSGQDTTIYSVYAGRKRYSFSSVIKKQINADTIYVNGQEYYFKTNSTLADVLEQIGNQVVVDVDWGKQLAPGEQAEVVAVCGDSSITLTIVNPYSEHISYDKAVIACYHVEGNDNLIQKCLEDIKHGVSTKQEVFDYYMQDVYEKSDESLTYKGYMLSAIDMSSLQNYTPVSKIYNDSGERDVVFLFEEDILYGFEIVAPALLYGGLQDNVSSNELTHLDPSYFTSVEEIRNSILDELRAAFVNANINVNINEYTGEVMMDNGVLFGVDEYELSSGGKKYVDDFLKIYASVLLDDRFADIISEIRIEGHTDTTGSDAYNLVLSQKRADTVRNWCVESIGNELTVNQKNIFSQKATAIGYSFRDPIYTNDGKVDMAASRRVAIKFYIDVEKAMSSVAVKK